MADFTRVRWDALRAARAKCRKNVVEAERSGDSDRIHTAYKLSSFLAEALPNAWDAVEERMPRTGWDALSDADKAEWTAMAAEMRDPETKACGCGYPQKECLRVVLRNGPPYPPRPCEPEPTICDAKPPSNTKPC